MIGVHLGLIVVFSFLLIKATEILIGSLKSLADATKLGEFFITSFVLALATSLPEFFVGVMAALEGNPALSLGNVIGSNIVDLSLVIGGAAFLGGGLAVRGDFLSRDVFYAFLGGAAPLLLLSDRSLSRLDGAILILLYVFYNFSVLREQFKKSAVSRGEKNGWWHQITNRLRHNFSAQELKELGWIFLGAALLLFSADILVKQATALALAVNMPVLIIGLFIVSLGTSLPEFVFEFRAVLARKPSMVFGDLLGSVVANGTLIIGVTALLQPFKVRAFADYLLATLAYVVVFALFYLFIRTKRRLERWEGASLIGFFLLFALLELAR